MQKDYGKEDGLWHEGPSMDQVSLYSSRFRDGDRKKAVHAQYSRHERMYVYISVDVRRS